MTWIDVRIKSKGLNFLNLGAQKSICSNYKQQQNTIRWFKNKNDMLKMCLIITYLIEKIFQNLTLDS